MNSSASSQTDNVAPDPQISQLPAQALVDIAQFRNTDDGRKLAQWVHSQFQKMKGARSYKQQQWVVNLSFFYGRQYLERMNRLMPGQTDSLLYTPRKPASGRRLTINRTRAFVRQELSKFISQQPSANVVPATAEDQDVRAAYAGEQVWESVSSNSHIERTFARSAWWMIVTGNGFIKTFWNNGKLDPIAQQQGCIEFGNVTPFNLYVPDMREQGVEDQPYILNAYVRPVGWCQSYFRDELKGITLSPTTTAANEIVESGYLNLSGAGEPDSCIVYEMWIKPGGHKLFPNGGVIIAVDDTLVQIALDGMPYAHNEYPFTKFEHIPTGTFYAASPLEDLNQLQKEYNTLRSEISESGRRMAKPKLLAQQGSIIPSKVTDEAGQIILYRHGFTPPTPMQTPEVPNWYVEQQNVILADWEEISGQNDPSKGQAPTGVTAGTALSYLQEQANAFLTPEYQSIEEGYEKIAKQTLVLFNQYVDVPRKIKTIGADGAFDTMLLSGSDISNGTDIRIQPGTSVSQSQAAKVAQVQSMYSIGLIPAEQALQLMELGGPQKVLDTVDAAKRKAQRENTRMKMLTPQAIQQYQQEFGLASMMGEQPTQNPLTGATQGDPVTGNPSALANLPLTVPPGTPPQPGPVISVDDFDLHQVHIETHNTFRMSEEYDTLDPAVKAQFALHVQLHQQALAQTSLSSFLQSMPSDGSDETAPGTPGWAPAGAGDITQQASQYAADDAAHAATGS